MEPLVIDTIFPFKSGCVINLIDMRHSWASPKIDPRIIYLAGYSGWYFHFMVNLATTNGKFPLHLESLADYYTYALYLYDMAYTWTNASSDPDAS